MARPTGVTAIAALFFLLAAYLAAIAVIMLISPGTVSMAAGAPLLSGLEVAGPYMFLLAAAVGMAVGIGLWRLHNWARRLAIALGATGIVLLIPSVSGSLATMHISGLAWGGLGIVVRAAVVWYLYQPPVAEQLSRSARTE